MGTKMEGSTKLDGMADTKTDGMADPKTDGMVDTKIGGMVITKMEDMEGTKTADIQENHFMVIARSQGKVTEPVQDITAMMVITYMEEVTPEDAYAVDAGMA